MEQPIVLRRILGRGVALAIVAVVAVAAVAFAAEVEAAELEGDTNRVTVEQGQTVTFDLSVRASGWIRCTATPENPATAVFDTRFDIGPDGAVGAGVPSDPLPFYKGANGGSLCRVTWPGDPASMTVQMTLHADVDAPLGDYAIWMQPTLFTPLGSGDRLQDRTRTFLMVTVVEGSDTVPPDVSCTGPHGTMGDNGWHVSGVSHDCVASDDGSGLADPADASFSMETTEEGVTSIPARTVADVAGNESTAGPFGPFKVDLVDPAALVSTPADGETFLLGSSASASFTCVDATSGVASCMSLDGVLDTNSVGSKTFRVEAVDHAGRATVVEHTYHVVYDFGGLTLTGPNHAQAGSAIPVSWTLNGIPDLGSFVAMSSGPCEGDASEPARMPGRSGVSYEEGEDEFRAVWKTDRGWSGACRTLQLHLADGTVHTADVAFR